MYLSLRVLSFTIMAFLLGIQRAEAGFGGGDCTISKTDKASTACTSQNNGVCVIDTLDIGNNMVKGKCACYTGYSGTTCQTKDSTSGTTSGTTSSSSSSSSSAGFLTAAALAGLGALLLSQNTWDGGFGAVGGSGGYPQQNLYG